MGLKCQILLKPPKEKVFRSGETIAGTVKYSLDKPTVIESINVSLKGKLKGKLTGNEPDKDKICKEIFVDLNKSILEEKENNTQAGVYDHTFEFLLPEDLPSSYRDKTCTISYKILVDFHIPEFVGSSPSFQTEIPVYGNVKPCSDEAFTCGITKFPFPSNKPMDLHVNAKKTFLTAGENIYLNIFVNNETNIPVNSVKTKLIAETIYKYDDKKKKVQKQILYENESPGAKENSEIEYKCTVPTPVSSFSIQHSKFFSREYKLSVTTVLPFPHRDASLVIPVAIDGRNNVFEMEVNSKHKALGFAPYVSIVGHNFGLARMEM